MDLYMATLEELAMPFIKLDVSFCEEVIEMTRFFRDAFIVTAIGKSRASIVIH